GPGAAVDHVVAVAFGPEGRHVDPVVAGTRLDGVVSGTHVEIVVAGITDREVTPVIARGAEVAGAGHRDVLEAGGERPVNVGDDRIDAARIGEHIARAHDVRVVSGAAAHRVGAAEALEQVASGSAGERVGEVVVLRGGVVAEKELAAIGEGDVRRGELELAHVRQRYVFARLRAAHHVNADARPYRGDP